MRVVLGPGEARRLAWAPGADAAVGIVGLSTVDGAAHPSPELGGRPRTPHPSLSDSFPVKTKADASRLAGDKVRINDKICKACSEGKKSAMYVLFSLNPDFRESFFPPSEKLF